jgi:ferredoxin
MADIKLKWPRNIPGRFFVDEHCIACDACVQDAPKFFAMYEEEGHAYVILQPTLESEIKECLEALANCPVEAIGEET